MGNSVYGKETPNLKFTDLVSVNQVPLSVFKAPASRIRQICMSTIHNFIYVSFHNSKKVHKYSFSDQKLICTYKFNETPVKYMELNISQTRLFLLDSNSINVIDCEKNCLKRVLHNYADGQEIGLASFFNSRFIVVSLKDSRSFDVFDTKTAIRESMRYRQSQEKSETKCLDFGCTRDGDKMVLLDSENLYIFRMSKLKEMLRIYHKGLETAILHVSMDSKYVFTLRKGYITARKLKTLEIIMKFKFRRFQDKSAFEIMQNDRILMLRDSVLGIRMIDLLDQEVVYTLRHPKLRWSLLLKDNRHLVTVDETKIDVYASDVELEFTKSAIQNKTKKEEVKPPLLNEIKLIAKYESIEDMVKRGQLEDALIECRDLLRVNPREHKAYFISGKLLMVKGFYEEGEAFLNQAIFLSLQKESSYFVWRGKALYFMKRYLEARDAFSKALALKPDRSSALKNLEITNLMLMKLNNNSSTEQPITNLDSISTDTEATITFDYESAFEKAFGHYSSSFENSGDEPKAKMFNFRADNNDDSFYGLLPKNFNEAFDIKIGDYYLSEEINMADAHLLKKGPNFKKLVSEGKETPLMDVFYARIVSSDQDQTISQELYTNNPSILSWNLKKTLKSEISDLGSQQTKREPPILVDSRKITKSKGTVTTNVTATFDEKSQQFHLLLPTHSQEKMRFN